MYVDSIIWSSIWFSVFHIGLEPAQVTVFAVPVIRILDISLKLWGYLGANTQYACASKLTHKGRDKIAAFSQTTFWNAFLECKCMNSLYVFTELCSYRSNEQLSNICSDNGLAQIRRQAIIWNNGGQVDWRIYASLGLNGLIVNLAPVRTNHWGRVTHICVSKLGHHNVNTISKNFCKGRY